MNIVSCFDNKGNKLDKGTLLNGNGTVKYYHENGILTEIKKYKEGLVQE